MYALTQGNHLERLADALVDELNLPRENPLDAPWVLVPHAEMGQWLARRVAVSTGVCGNVHFTAAANGVWALLQAANPEIGSRSPFEAHQLTARIYALLPVLRETGEFQLVQRFLAGQDSAAQMVFAARVARIFTEYLIFRPDWLTRWESTDAGDWQGWLWRRLTQGKLWHWAKALQWLDKTPNPDVSSLGIPRLHVFALPTMAPALFRVISRLSDQLPIHVYHWTPTAAFWPDVPSPRSPSAVAQPEAMYVSALLASLGQPLKDMAELLFADGPNEQDVFVSVGRPALLAAVQDELLDLDPNQDMPALDLDSDRSIRVIRCTTRQREVEVCRDHLQNAFDHQPDLAPDQVLIICPDLPAYLPALKAELGPPGRGRHWPWRLLGASGARGLGAAAALLESLNLLTGEILDRRCLTLLQYPAVARRMGLGPSALDDVHRWVETSGLFEHGVDSKFSWNKALDRLVDALTLDPALIPAGGLALKVHPSEAESVGALYRLLSVLQRYWGMFQQPASLSRWVDRLRQCSLALLSPTHEDNDALVALLRNLADLSLNDGVEIDLPALVSLLECIQPDAYYGGGRTGGVTVSTPAAVRLLPAKIVYVLGVTDGEFPRPVQRSELNLMDTESPRKGDRARHLEDRQLLLEWISAARDQLVLSGRSRNPVSAEPESMSTLIQELLAHCQRRHGVDEAPLVWTPPLHGFSPEYAGQEKGYSTHFNVNEEGNEPSTSSNPVFAGMSLRARAPGEISLDDLCSFWSSPPRWFVEQVLNIWLNLPAGTLEPLPPVAVNALQEYQLLGRAEALDPGRLAERIELPEGPLGAVLASNLSEEHRQLHQRLEKVVGSHQSSGQSISVTLGDWTLSGALDHVYADQRVALTSAKVKPKRLLDLWIRHLALCCVRPQAKSVLIGRDQSVALSRVADPQAELRQLIQGFAAGHQAPLPFFPATSRASADRKSVSSAFDSDYEGGQSAYVQLAFRDAEPLSADFGALADQIWAPVKAHEIDAGV